MPMDERRPDPRGAGRDAHRAAARRAAGSSCSTRCRTSTTRPASRCAAERRPRVLEIAARHGVLVLEDDPYGLLGFDGEPLPALRADDADGVVYLGSFSKTFAPGLPRRLGRGAARGPGASSCWPARRPILCPSLVRAARGRHLPADHDWRDQIKVYRELYRERRDAPLDALATCMPAGTPGPARGRLLRLGRRCPTGSTPRRCCRGPSPRGWPTCPGTAFYADGQGRGHLRLSYCYPTPERIREGVRRLAGVVDAELELRRRRSAPQHRRRSPRAPSPTRPALPHAEEPAS